MARGVRQILRRIRQGTPTWTEGALVGFFEEYSGVINIYRGPTDPVTGPVRSTDIVLRDKATGKRLLSLEDVSISNARDWLICNRVPGPSFEGETRYRSLLVRSGTRGQGDYLCPRR